MTLADIDANGLYTAADVARVLFNKRANWFYGHRRRELMRRDGFPHPLSSQGRPHWLGADLLSWAKRPKTTDGVTITSRDTLIDFAAELRARAEAVAGPPAHKGARHVSRR